MGVLLCFFISGCSYQVINFPNKNSQSYRSNNASVSSVPSSGYHRVKRGETLFSIAFSYGLDYREVANLNKIRSPYTIYPKQKIWLRSKGRSVAKSVKATPTRSPSRAAVVKKSASDIQLQKTKPRPKVASKSSSSSSNIVSSWHWPIDGTVVKGFSSGGVSSKGIDIKGQKGNLVKVAANGTVVYAGSGLIGYGNLVIVKHNDVYLSAYAYNEKILVKEQQTVRAGDALAVIGGRGSEKSLLHFEVRRDGQPIDPLKVLPRK